MRGLTMGLWLGLILMTLACQAQEDPAPLPTALQPDQAATDLAQEQTQTQAALAVTAPPTATPPSWTPTWTLTLSPSPFLSSTPRPSLTPSITLTPSTTPTERPRPMITATPSFTATFTPSPSPTRALNPDAVVTGQAAALRIEPNLESPAVTTLALNTALRLEGRSADNAWLRVSLLNGQGDGWVASSDVVVFIDLDSLLILGGSAPANRPFSLATPTLVSTQTAGSGLPFRAYDFAACGDTYWEGDGLGASLETLAFQGRYPRFAMRPIRVYLYGLGNLSAEQAEQWELAISQAFAELSQAVTLERVALSDLDFFQPSVPLPALLQDQRVDMIWHILAPESYAQNALCASESLSCAQVAYTGAVRGGPLKFVSMVYVQADAPDPKAALLQAALPALGLWAQSATPQDIAAPLTQATRLSARDVATLRCLYNAPPYGDSNLGE